MHPEKPERLAGLLSAMRGPWKSEFGDAMHVFEPAADVTDEQLARVHTKAHMDVVAKAFERSASWPLPVNIDSDTIASKGSGPAARRAAGLVVAAVDSVWGACDVELAAVTSSWPRRAFVMVRPPGHHAEASRPMGFCMYNNVMVGVAHAQEVHGLNKVAILDFDVHHGNGDESIAWDDASRLYASSHQSPCYPGTGDRAGRAGAHGNILSSPLPPGAGSDEFRGAWREVLLPAVRKFEPEAIFISAGFDGHAEDPLASLALSHDDFAWLTREIVQIGGGELPIVSVLEGGYNVDALVGSARAHVHALING